MAELDALQAEVDALKRLQAETPTELHALMPSILDRAFSGELYSETSSPHPTKVTLKSLDNKTENDCSRRSALRKKGNQCGNNVLAPAFLLASRVKRH